MDIHKPKPWRRVREFLKEYLIIVIGVLTALAGEQAVQMLHHRAEVAEARRALDAEVGFDLASFDFTLAQTRCMGQRLDELDRWLASWDSGRPLKIAAPLPTIPGVIFRSSVWRVASVAAIGEMSFQARVDYGKFYDGVANNEGVKTREVELWRDLSRLGRARTLSDEQRLSAEDDIEQLRAYNDGLAGRARYLHEFASALKVGSTASATARFTKDFGGTVETFCKPLLAAE